MKSGLSSKASRSKILNRLLGKAKFERNSSFYGYKEASISAGFQEKKHRLANDRFSFMP